MAPPLRIGLLGASAIAPWVIVEPARRRSDVRVQAVAARELARAQRFAAEHGVAHVASDYAALVAREDIDLVYNALPPSEHLRWTVAALQAGKAVLCEKPLALTCAEVTAMFDAADTAQRPLWEAMHYHHHPAMASFLAAVRGGAIGSLRSVVASFVGHMPRRPGEIRWQAALGGGATLDLGCYALHAARTLLGDPLRVSSARAQIEAGIDAALTAELVSAAGVPVHIECSFLAAEHHSRLVATGSTGVLRFENFTSPSRHGELVLEREGPGDGPPERMPIDPCSTYDAQLAFVARHHAAATDPAQRADSLANMALIESLLYTADVHRTPR